MRCKSVAGYSAIKLQFISFDLIFEFDTPRLNDSDNDRTILPGGKPTTCALSWQNDTGSP